MEDNKGSPRYTIEYVLSKNIAIHCPTEKEWHEVLAVIRTKIPQYPDIDRNWKECEKESCLNPKSSYYSKKWYIDEGFTVIDAITFLEHNKPVVEYKVGQRVKIISGCSMDRHNGKTGVITTVDTTSYSFKGGLIKVKIDDSNAEVGCYTVTGTHQILNLQILQDVKEEYSPKVGDWVTVTGSDNGHSVGYTGKIRQIGTTDVLLETYYSKFENIRPATQAEINRVNPPVPYTEPIEVVQDDKKYIEYNNATTTYFTAGRKYEVIRETDNHYEVIMDCGRAGYLKKENAKKTDNNSNTNQTTKTKQNGKQEESISNTDSISSNSSNKGKEAKELPVITTYLRSERTSSVSGKAINLSGDTQTVCTGNRRTPTAVGQPGQSLSTVRGYTSNREGIRLS